MAPLARKKASHLQDTHLHNARDWRPLDHRMGAQREEACLTLQNVIERVERFAWARLHPRKNRPLQLGRHLTPAGRGHDQMAPEGGCVGASPAPGFPHPAWKGPIFAPEKSATRSDRTPALI